MFQSELSSLSLETVIQSLMNALNSASLNAVSNCNNGLNALPYKHVLMLTNLNWKLPFNNLSLFLGSNLILASENFSSNILFIILGGSRRIKSDDE